MISKYGEQDQAIEALKKSDAEQNVIIAEHGQRITTAEEDIDAVEGRCSDLEERMTTAENDIDALETSVSGLSDDLSALAGRVSSAEDDIDTLETLTSGMSEDISALSGRVTTAEDDIDAVENRCTTLENNVQANTNDITGLDSRVTSLEGHSVIANQGGSTSAVLSTLNVDGVNYEVPQGGSGGGSTVIPNASGTSQGDLNTIGIDGYIYDIPSGVDTSEMIAGAYNPSSTYYEGMIVTHGDYLYKCIDNGVTGTWDSSKWTRTTCSSIASDAVDTAEAVEGMYADLGTAYEDTASYQDETASSGETVGPGMPRTLTPGSWIVTFNATFDTHELGSKQRSCNIYLKVNDVTVAQNSKYMWGSEAVPGVIYANSTSLTCVVDVPYGSTKVIKPCTAVRVNTGSGDYDVDVRCGYVRIKPYSA